MIVGMSIIVSIIFKEFFLIPKNNIIYTNVPKFIQIPDNSKLESVKFKDNKIIMIVNLIDGTQQIILLTIEDGIEKSRQYIEVINKN